MLTWVWLGLVVVARLGAAQSGGGFLPVPVWKFMNVSDGADPSDLGRPQFGCGDEWLSVRLRLVRHSDLSLEDGRKLSSLPDKCGGTSQTFGSWLLLKFPYTGCPVESLVLNGTNFHQLKLRYFDHLLQNHVTAEASCQDPATRQGLAAPLVRCTASDVTVKLPLGGSLQRVEALGEDGVVGTAIATNTTADAVFIQISRTPDTDSFLEITLLDSAGEMSTVVSACLNGTVRDHQPRSPKPSRTSDSDDEDEDSSEPDEEEDASDSEAADSEDSEEEEDDEADSDSDSDDEEEAATDSVSEEDAVADSDSEDDDEEEEEEEEEGAASDSDEDDDSEEAASDSDSEDDEEADSDSEDDEEEEAASDLATTTSDSLGSEANNTASSGLAAASDAN